MEGGEEFLRIWDVTTAIVGIYGLARLVIASPKILRNLGEAWGNFKGKQQLKKQNKALYEQMQKEINAYENQLKNYYDDVNKNQGFAEQATPDGMVKQNTQKPKLEKLDETVETADDLKRTDVDKSEKSGKFEESSLDNVNQAGDVVRGINKSDFLATVGDFSDGANAKIADQAWTLWKNENWVELENLFNANNLNKYNGLSFPPNNGAVNVIKKTLDPADFNGNLVIDRYGATTGKFTAPANTPFPERALPSSYASQTPQKYKVLQPIPNVEEGQIIPWFNQPGLGIQYKLEKSVQYYIDEGYLLPIP